jgi:hypothetical protein
LQCLRQGNGSRYYLQETLQELTNLMGFQRALLAYGKYKDFLGKVFKSLQIEEQLEYCKPHFGHKPVSLQKLLVNANKTGERAAKFINKIKSRWLAARIELNQYLEMQL